MLRAAMLLCVISLTATGTLHAGQVIETEKLPADQVKQALLAASDDTVVEIGGQSKTKAEWRSYFQAQRKPPDAAKVQQAAAERKAQFDAVAKALQDQQDSANAAQNAQSEKDFEELKSR